MSENSKPLKNLGNVTTLALASIFLVILGEALYYGMSFLSIIVVIGGIFSYSICFYWLFKRRNNHGAKISLLITLISIILAIWTYVNLWFGIRSI
jgi:hypothetical protein